MRSSMKKIIEVAVHMTLANDKDPFSLPEVNALTSDPILMFVNNKFIEGHYHCNGCFYSNDNGLVCNLRKKVYNKETETYELVDPPVYWCYATDFAYIDTLKE